MKKIFGLLFIISSILIFYGCANNSHHGSEDKTEEEADAASRFEIVKDSISCLSEWHLIGDLYLPMDSAEYVKKVKPIKEIIDKDGVTFGGVKFNRIDASFRNNKVFCIELSNSMELRGEEEEIASDLRFQKRNGDELEMLLIRKYGNPPGGRADFGSGFFLRWDFGKQHINYDVSWSKRYWDYRDIYKQTITFALSYIWDVEESKEEEEAISRMIEESNKESERKKQLNDSLTKNL